MMHTIKKRTMWMLLCIALFSHCTNKSSKVNSNTNFKHSQNQSKQEETITKSPFPTYFLSKNVSSIKEKQVLDLFSIFSYGFDTLQLGSSDKKLLFKKLDSLNITSGKLALPDSQSNFLNKMMNSEVVIIKKSRISSNSFALLLELNLNNYSTQAIILLDGHGKIHDYVEIRYHDNDIVNISKINNSEYSINLKRNYIGKSKFNDDTQLLFGYDTVDITLKTTDISFIIENNHSDIKVVDSKDIPLDSIFSMLQIIQGDFYFVEQGDKMHESYRKLMSNTNPYVFPQFYIKHQELWNEFNVNDPRQFRLLGKIIPQGTDSQEYLLIPCVKLGYDFKKNELYDNSYFFAYLLIYNRVKKTTDFIKIYNPESPQLTTRIDTNIIIHKEVESMCQRVKSKHKFQNGTFKEFTKIIKEINGGCDP